MYSSADGSTWTATSSPVLGYSGMGLFMFDRASLAVRNGTVYVLFCGIDGDLPAQYFSPDTGLAQSTDEGKTWTPLPVPTSGAPFRTSSRLVFQEMGNDEQTLIVPTGSNELLVGGIGLWMTPDITASNPIWSDISIHTPLVYPGQHAVAAVNSTTWFDGTEGGVWLTSDSGSTWSDDNATLADHQLFDASPEGSPGAYVAADGQLGTGVANNDGTLAWSQSASSSSLNTAVDPDNPQHVYAQNNAFALISDDGGKTFSNGFRLPDVLYTGPGGTPPPFEVLPQRPSDLIFSSCQLWLGSGYAEPFGGDVRAVSFDLSQDGPESDCSQLKGFVFGIASAPSDANVLYAVTTNRRVMGTTNLFADKPVWTNLTADPLPTTPNHPFSAIAVSPTDAKTVYVGVGGFQTPHVFKSSDGGASWMDVTGNLPDAPVNSITVDPVDPTNVYVATDAGVFVATDGGVTGETWQVMGAGLPNAPVMSLKFAPGSTRVLVAATHGRGAWAIAPLSTKPDFSLQISPDFLTASGSQPLQITASIAAINAYSGTVTLSCVTPTTGCTIAQPSVQAGQSATISVDPSALPQGGPVTISATDGTLTHTQTADVEIPHLTVSPSPVIVAGGGFVTVTGHDLGGSATVGCQDLPVGLTCGTDSVPISDNNPQFTLLVLAAPTVVPGDYSIQVTATTATQTFAVPVAVHVPGFTLQANPSQVLVGAPNGPATGTIAASSVVNFTSPITLACDPASGVQCAFSPATITPGQSSTVTISQLGALSQPLSVNVIGTAGTETEQTQLTVTLAPLTVKAPRPLAIAKPGSDAAMLYVEVSGVPAGIVPAFSCSSTANLTCRPSPAGISAYDIYVSGLSSLPAGTVSVPFTLQVTLGSQQASVDLAVQFGDFILSPDQYLKQVVSGTDTTSFTVTAAPQNGTQWTAPVPLTCTAPSGVSCSLTPGSITPGQSATLNVSGLGTLKPQQLNVYVNGSPNPDAHQMKLYIQVADFQLSSLSASTTLAAGADTATFTIHDTASMRGPVQLACANSAPISCSFSPANLVGGTSSTLTVSGLSKATATNDAIAVNVTGTAGTDSHTLALSVNVPDFVPAPASGSSTSQTVTAGQTAKYSLDYSAVNGFSGNVTMSCSGAPAQATCSVSPAAFTLSGGTTQPVTVSVQTTGSSLTAPVDGDRPGSAPQAGLLALLGLAALASLAALPRRRRIAFGAALLFGALLLAGCGGGGGSSTPAPPAVQPTPSGSSTLTVTATANGVAHTTQLTLKVQ